MFIDVKRSIEYLTEQQDIFLFSEIKKDDSNAMAQE